MSRKRLSINLPVATYEELRALATATDRTMTDVIRTAFGLVKLAMREEAAGNVLVVTDAKGRRVVRQIVL